jgi:two-component system, OmpR family, phosphate regulon sensor histidine kinase PhoR
MVVRTSLPLTAVDWSLQSVLRNIAISVIMVSFLFALVALHLARRISKPLEDMRIVAQRLAGGDLCARVGLTDNTEFGVLGRALNRMADQLGERMETVTRQRNEQESVLKSMVEGVLAVDKDERIINVNSAAATLLDLQPEQARGRSIQECVRNRDLQEFISEALSLDAPREREIVMAGNEERNIQLHGTALADSTGTRIGALVVLNDITRLKRLETIRRDFVANLSHELKTPITALKGCVETLEESELAKSGDTMRFVAMMRRHADRLNAIVEDLLSLSRIEFEAERKEIQLDTGEIADVLRRSAQAFVKSAEAKSIAIQVECPEDLKAPINAALLEQAVGNIIDNAVKYSGEGTAVSVKAGLKDRTIEISVSDQGPGIERKHLGRIFERFYRVDHARSRALGGTGLGLAIVKHIAIAHHGSVDVESTPGQGSTFTIRIPVA